MKKLWKNIIFVSIATIISFCGFKGIHVSKLSVKSEPEEKKSELFLPGSYEEYLPLNSASGIAVCDKYIAVADGSDIYVYDKVANEYKVFSHGYKITKVEFAENGYLYYTDLNNTPSPNRLYAINPATNPLSQITLANNDIGCISFSIMSDIVYYTMQSGSNSLLLKIPLANLSAGEISDQPLTDRPINGSPALYSASGNCYYTEGAYLRKLTANNSWTLPKGTPSSIAIVEGNVYYTTTSKEFYDYSLNALTAEETPEPLFSAKDCSSVAVSNSGEIYVVQGNSVRKYSAIKKEFLSYEIGSDSSSPARLSGASDLFLSGNNLYIADTNNNRISISNKTTRAIKNYSLEFSPSYVCADENTILAASSTNLSLLSNSNGELISDFSASFTSSDPIIGAVNVYGKFYIATNTLVYCIQKDAGGEYTLTTGKGKTLSNATLLASDVFGDIYVGYSDLSVRKFTESQFISLDINDTGTIVVSALPVDTKKILVDFNRNVYALTDNLYICANAQPAQEKDISDSLVYSQDASTTISSIAFNVEEDEVFVLYDGNFISKNYTVSIPTVQSILVNGVDEQVFSSQSAIFALVEIPESSLYVDFDIEKLNGAEFFPYLSYARSSEKYTALKLGETELFNIVAVFNKESNSYSAALVEKSVCEEISSDGVLKDAEEYKLDPTGYITTEIPLYKYPYLTDLLIASNLPKYSKIEVLKQLDELDYKYYYIKYADENGVEYTGYVPQSYVSDFDGRPPITNEQSFGNKETDIDSLWRLGFILLGGAIICILTDYLILRKRK